MFRNATVLLLTIISCLSAHAQGLLIIQSAAISDLYGNSIATYILETKETESDYVTVFRSRNFSHDRSERSRDVLTGVISSYVEEAKPTEILVLGNPVLALGMPAIHHPILSGSQFFNNSALEAAPSFNVDWAPVYMISGRSVIESLRRQTVLDNVDRGVNVVYVDTVQQYHKALLNLQKEPRGTLILNVFSVLDEWQQPVGYDTIEEIAVKTNTRHLDVGVCREGFKTALALGPTAREAAIMAMSSYSSEATHISSCANLRRLNRYWPGVYKATSGRYDLVEGG